MSVLAHTIRTVGYTDPLLGEAVDELERLELENARLRNLLMMQSKEAHTMEAKPLLFYPEITLK